MEQFGDQCPAGSGDNLSGTVPQIQRQSAEDNLKNISAFLNDTAAQLGADCAAA